MWDPTFFSFSAFWIDYNQEIRDPIMWDPTFFSFSGVLDRLQSKDTGSQHVGAQVPACGALPFSLFPAFDWLQSKDTGSHHVGPHLFQFFRVLDRLHSKDTGSHMLVQFFQRFGSIANKRYGVPACGTPPFSLFAAGNHLSRTPAGNHLSQPPWKTTGQSKGAGGMGEALRYIYIYQNANSTVPVSCDKTITLHSFFRVRKH